MLQIGDLFVYNDKQEKSPIYQITKITNDEKSWHVKPIMIFTESSEVIFNFNKKEKDIIKIKNPFSLQYLGDRDPWDFYIKLEEFELLLELNNSNNNEKALKKIINDRDYEIMNWAIFIGVKPTPEMINSIVKTGDLLMITLLAGKKIFPPDESLTWAIENNMSSIIAKLLFIGLIPSTSDINWACLNLPASTVELIMVCGFVPDTAGVKYLKESGDLHKQVLVDIFKLV